ERLEGHFTASAWLVDRTGSRTLLTHHRKLGRWLQPGGHADGDRDLARVALREAQEESGLHGLRVEPAIFDLDRHWIPEHRGVPGHWHYDVRYVVRAGDDEDFVVGEESLALAWRGIQAVAADAGADPSLRRMARRWLVERAPAPACAGRGGGRVRAAPRLRPRGGAGRPGRRTPGTRPSARAPRGRSRLRAGPRPGRGRAARPACPRCCRRSPANARCPRPGVRRRR